MTLTLYKVIFPVKKSIYNQRKNNFKLGLANHIAINMDNEGIDKEKTRNFKKINDTKKSKKYCDHSKDQNFIPASWVKYIHDEIQKRLLFGSNNLIDEIKDENPSSSIKIIFLKVIHKISNQGS